MAEVALAIVPICLTALNGISLLRAKLKIIRRHDREVDWIRRKLRVQVGNFKDELWRILVESCEARGTIAPGRTEFMIWGKDARNAPEWREKKTELETSIREYLGEKFRLFHECIGEVEVTTRQMREQLSVFAGPNERVTWSRKGKDAFRIAFNKQEYNEQIGVLMELNEEMRRLRDMAKFINKRKPSPPPPYSDAVNTSQRLAAYSQSNRSSGMLLRRYKASRRILADFLALLSSQWSCKNNMHSRHKAQVLLQCIEPYKGEARLGLLLRWSSQQGARINRCIVALHVSKQDQMLHVSGLLSPPATSASPVSSRSDPSLDQSIMDFDVPAPKRPRMLPPETTAYSLQPSPDTIISQDSLCTLFTQSPVSYTFADLKLSETSHFDFEAGDEAVNDVKVMTASRVIALTDLLDFPVYDVVSDRHRITVALTLVKAMLKFHSTRAWPSGCLISSVKLYSGADETDRDLAASLSTLHISASLDSENDDVDMDSPQYLSPESIQEAKDTFGIQNMVLYCLGVALLQIGLWEAVQWTDVAQVRRKTARLSYLGEKYHRMTRKLVYGTLDSGASDLRSDRLQEAVIQEVVLGLEGLLNLTRVTRSG